LHCSVSFGWWEKAAARGFGSERFNNVRSGEELQKDSQVVTWTPILLSGDAERGEESFNVRW
jgi:hypothetical protein